MDEEKRSNQNYEIIESCTIGSTELVIGHNPNSPNPYVCWYCKGGSNYFWGYYTNELDDARHMLNFGKLYDIISDEEKKSLITYLIKEIQIYPNGESEKPLKSIEFNFPIYRDGQEVRRLLWEKGNTVETVCLLVLRNPVTHINIDVDVEEMVQDKRGLATYEQIKDYVLEHSGLKVSSLYIAQVKQKCGIIERENYNKPKSENAKQPQCPLEKERAITEALKHFGMI